MRDTIGQLAERLGMKPDTIRHYKDVGLLQPYVQENGYCIYSYRDALMALFVKELRSLELPLGEIRHFVQKEEISQYMSSLDTRQAQLEHRAKRIQEELARIDEIRRYTSYGVEGLGTVDQFQGRSIYSIDAAGPGNPPSPGSTFAQWLQHFPFVHISVKLPVEELGNSKFEGPYSVRLGLGAVENYVEQFSLPVCGQTEVVPAGPCLRTCIAVEDIYSIYPQNLAPLLQCARDRRCRFADNSSGRLLFIQNAKKKPVYYILLWVRVEDADK